jgi:hypothetical protein
MHKYVLPVFWFMVVEEHNMSVLENTFISSPTSLIKPNERAIGWYFFPWMNGRGLLYRIPTSISQIIKTEHKLLLSSSGFEFFLFVQSRHVSTEVTDAEYCVNF